jgi:hypothetical protein
MDFEKRRQRKADISRRARNTETMWSRCRVFECGRPTTAAARKGLNRMYCRAHEDHFERHGSFTKGSYTAAQLAPHRRTAEAWLRAHRDRREVQLAIRAVEGLYGRAGAFVEAFRLRGLSPQERARAAWARLREARVDPLRPLAAWLAVELALAADPQAERKPEFKRVQAAKLVHRISSGSHKRWERQLPDGQTAVQELHKYPHSRGQVLRHLGQQIERATELATEAYLRDNAVLLA